MNENNNLLDNCCCLSEFEIQLCKQTENRVAKEILQDWYNDVVHGMGVEGHYILEYAKKYGIQLDDTP